MLSPTLVGPCARPSVRADCPSGFGPDDAVLRDQSQRPQTQLESSRAAAAGAESPAAPKTPPPTQGFVFQQALPERCQPRYTVPQAPEAKARGRLPFGACLLDHWQNPPPEAPVFLGPARAALLPAELFCAPETVQPTIAPGLLALRQAYTASLAADPDTCAIRSDPDSAVSSAASAAARQSSEA